MNLQSQADQLNPRYEECLRLHKCWCWFFWLGICLIVLGAMAIGAGFIAALATVLAFGILLICAGVVQIVNAFLARSWRGFFLHLLVGTLQLILGILMTEYPVRAAADVTLVLALALLVGGLARVFASLIEQFADWGWVFLNGLIATLLGIAIWRRWPDSTEWVIGTFVGIDLILNGWSWVMLGLLVKAHRPPAPSSEANAPKQASVAVS
jgi:uncharacterized membrane protein HdeD (DUF308 family)